MGRTDPLLPNEESRSGSRGCRPSVSTIIARLQRCTRLEMITLPRKSLAGILSSANLARPPSTSTPALSLADPNELELVEEGRADCSRSEAVARLRPNRRDMLVLLVLLGGGKERAACSSRYPRALGPIDGPKASCSCDPCSATRACRRGPLRPLACSGSSSDRMLLVLSCCCTMRHGQCPPLLSRRDRDLCEL